MRSTPQKFAGTLKTLLNRSMCPMLSNCCCTRDYDDYGDGGGGDCDDHDDGDDDDDGMDEGMMMMMVMMVDDDDDSDVLAFINSSFPWNLSLWPQETGRQKASRRKNTNTCRTIRTVRSPRHQYARERCRRAVAYLYHPYTR